MNGPELITHGCRLNIAESETIGAMLAGEDDLIVVNSCAVTAEAVATARKAIRRARRERPHARIIVTGCAAETEPETFRAMAEVSDVVPNLRKFERALYPTRYRDPPPMAIARTGHARTFLPVQNGCDHRCTFCIIPYGRGPSRSVPMGAVVEQMKQLVGNGYRELVLTGVDITSYGTDLPGRRGCRRA